MFLLLGAILGIAVSLYIQFYNKRMENDRENFSTKKLDDALEKAVKRMQLEMKVAGRKLTEEEKNAIIFGFLEESNSSNQQSYYVIKKIYLTQNNNKNGATLWKPHFY